MDKKVIIYGLVDNRMGCIFYIGATQNFELRKHAHIKRPISTGVRFYRTIRELHDSGGDFDIVPLDIVEPERRDMMERTWIIRCIDRGEPLINSRPPCAQPSLATRQRNKAARLNFPTEQEPTT